MQGIHFNPISTGGAPERFSSITQKREKLFTSNLATFFIDKWVTICTIHVAMVMAQIKGFKNDIFKKRFSILTIEMKAETINY